jgi:Tol biopolymer transport system component
MVKIKKNYKKSVKNKYLTISIIALLIICSCDKLIDFIKNPVPICDDFNPTITFQSEFYNRNHDIFVMDIETLEIRNLTTNLCSLICKNNRPSFSPDGSKISFYSDKDGTNDIFIMDVDGKNPHNLIKSPHDDRYPSFSPDGAKIVFSSRTSTSWEVFLINSDGSGLQNLTNHSAWDGSPKFSPDGSKIAFTSNRDGDEDIYLINIDGTNLLNLTNNNILDLSFDFTPDGQFIIYDSGSNRDLYIMNAVNGQNKKRLTNNRNDFHDPVVSPKGNKVVFRSFDGSWVEIYIMNIDGSGLFNLGRGRQAQFSADGNRIAYVNDSDIWIIDLSTMKKYNLTNDHLNYYRYPMFCPVLN